MAGFFLFIFPDGGYKRHSQQRVPVISRPLPPLDAWIGVLDLAHEGVCDDRSGDSTLLDALVRTMSKVPQAIGLLALRG